MMFKSNEFRMIEYKELVSDSFILSIQKKGKGGNTCLYDVKVLTDFRQ